MHKDNAIEKMQSNPITTVCFYRFAHTTMCRQRFLQECAT